MLLYFDIIATKLRENTTDSSQYKNMKKKPFNAIK